MRIDISIAMQLVNNYKTNHWATINKYCPSITQKPGYPNVQDSRCVWVSLTDLQAFIATISQYNADGIRIYFGEYSQAIVDAAIAADPTIVNKIPGFADYAGLHTVLLMPTASDGTYHCDFNYSDPLNQPGKAHLPSDFTNWTDMAAEDNGQLIPPPYYNNQGQIQNVGEEFMLYCDAHPTSTVVEGESETPGPKTT